MKRTILTAILALATIGLASAQKYFVIDFDGLLSQFGTSLLFHVQF